MADYHPLIARAVAGLEKNTGENRRALYERARTALVAQLRGVVPALDESEITRERLALEEAIRKVEAEAARHARETARPNLIKRAEAARREEAPRPAPPPSRPPVSDAPPPRPTLPGFNLPSPPPRTPAEPSRPSASGGDAWRMRRCANSARPAATRHPGSRPGGWKVLTIPCRPSRRRRRRSQTACRNRAEEYGQREPQPAAGKPVGVAARWIAAGGARGLRSAGAAAGGGSVRGGRGSAAVAAARPAAALLQRADPDRAHR